MDDSDHDDGYDGGMEIFFDEVKTQVKEYKNAVHDYAKADKNNKKKKLDSATQAEKSAEEAINIFKNELKHASEADKSQFSKNFKKQESSFKELKEELKGLKEGGPAPETKQKKTIKTKNEELFGEEETKKSKKNLGASDDVELAEVTTKKKKKKGGQMMQEQPDEVNEILEIQNQTDEIMKDMLKTADETIEIGAAAQERLKQQTEKLLGIQRELDEMGSNLQVARKELTGFMRALACDHCMGKVIIVAIILVAIAVVVIIILRSVYPNIFEPSTVAPAPTTTVAPTTVAPTTTRAII
ncbi:SNARE 11 [Acrasis kona]|uniref:SNARE 11 n=1 Tax=Acrasis kona TaxID=1008807 RepID=A0AAW2Z1R4_9EUKA